MKRLRFLCAQLEPAIENASSSLFRQVDRIASASALMKGVECSTRPDARLAMLAQSDRLMADMDRAREKFLTLQALLSRIEAETRAENAVLGHLRRDIRVAVMIAFNARIVSSAVQTKSGIIDSFAQSVHVLLRNAEKDLAALEDIQARATNRLTAASERLRGLGGQVNAMQADQSKVPILLHHLGQSDATHQAAETFGGAAGDVADALVRAMTSLQGGDAIRQRLEHVIGAIALCDAGSPTATAASAVAQALLRDLRSTLLADIGATRHQIAAMAQPLSRSETALRSLSDSGLTDAATAAGHAFAGLSQAAVALADHGDSLHAELALMGAEYDKKVEAAGRLSDIEDRILLLGINATLVSRGKGADGLAMAAIARQLREVSQAIVASTSRLMSLSMGQRHDMQTVFDTEADAAVSGAGPAGAAEVDLMTFGDTMAALGQLSFADVSRALREVDARLNDVAETSLRLKIPPEGPPISVSEETRRALDPLRSSYTIAIERQIHDAVLGVDAATDANAADVGLQSDLDEMFF
ncbi:hypothetical protein ACOI1H_11300 [Loktanella sp. DJP18]|uniref:hypothetical protein n=1 Tax=Loktanella sp. DJP18 TaxID=3409788 RepID=UPI003BB693A4